MRDILRKALIVLLSSASCLWAQQQDTRLLEQQFQEGQRALAEGRYAEASEAFEKLIELDPGTAELHATLGFSYFQQGKFGPASAALRQALKLNPKLPNVDVLLAMSVAELGRYEEALPGLKKGFQQSADAALRRMAGLQLQRAYTGLQRDDEAVETALQLARLYPEDPEILYHASRLYANLAYLTASKLSEVAPDSVWLHQAAGEAHESQGNHVFAISEYRKVVKLAPNRPGIHFRLGRVLLTQPDAQEKASEAFERELEIDPTNANAAYEVGEIYRKSAQLDKARKFFELALQHYPDFEEAQLGLGRVLMALRQPQAALPHLGKAAALNPENEVPHYLLWQVHRALGNEAEQRTSLAEFQRLRKQKSEYEESRTRIMAPREVTQQELDSEEVP